jgi:hypothetical protein
MMGCAMKTLTWEQAAEWTNSVGLNATVDRSVQGYPTKDGKGERVCIINKSIYFAQAVTGQSCVRRHWGDSSQGDR